MINYRRTYDNFKAYAFFSGSDASFVYNGKFYDETQRSEQTLKDHSSVFYRSLHYVDSALAPVRSLLVLGCLAALIAVSVPVLALVALVMLSATLLFLYLSYLPAKLITKITGKEFFQDTSTLAKYIADSLKCMERCTKERVNEIFVASGKGVIDGIFCVSAAPIWILALAVTPLVWSCEKVASKLEDLNIFSSSKKEANL